jgi:hypothetical protein
MIIERIAIIAKDATQKEKLDAATWLVLSCLSDTQPGMTEGFHRLDVVTRHCGDVMTQARGILSRYGNSGSLNK